MLTYSQQDHLNLRKILKLIYHLLKKVHFFHENENKKNIYISFLLKTAEHTAPIVKRHDFVLLKADCKELCSDGKPELSCVSTKNPLTTGSFSTANCPISISKS